MHLLALQDVIKIAIIINDLPPLPAHYVPNSLTFYICKIFSKHFKVCPPNKKGNVQKQLLDVCSQAFFWGPF